MASLMELDGFLNQVSTEEVNRPAPEKIMQYVLIKECGLSFEEYDKTPIPRLMELLDVYVYLKKKEAEAHKKGMK